MAQLTELTSDIRRITDIAMVTDGIRINFEPVRDPSLLTPGEIVVRMAVSSYDANAVSLSIDDLAAVWTICIAETADRVRPVWESVPFAAGDHPSIDLLLQITAWVAASGFPRNTPFAEATSPQPKRPR